MDAKTVGPDEVQIECGKLAREANREFRELDSEIKSLETALAQEREKVGKLRKAATFARRGCESRDKAVEELIKTWVESSAIIRERCPYEWAFITRAIAAVRKAREERGK
jgi:phage shock protein A